MVPRERHREGDGGLDVHLDMSRERAFVITTCFTEDGYFEWSPLNVPPADTRNIEEMDSAARMKQVADDGASMAAVLKEVEEDKKAAKDRFGSWIWPSEILRTS